MSRAFCSLGLGLLLLGLAGPAWATAVWPVIALPEQAQRASVGQQVEARGVPMRLQAFEWAVPMAQALAWFQRQLGADAVLAPLAGGGQVLGRMQGPHYLSVQLQATVGGVKGVAAVSDMAAAWRDRASYAALRERWERRLGYGAQTQGLTLSQDPGKESLHWVASHPDTVQGTVQRLRAELLAEGFRLEREVSVDDSQPRQLPRGSNLWFAAPGREAIVVVTPGPSGGSTVVMNVVTQQGSPR
ncbi:hypothetical protein HNP55_001142 [Paucibacter oligotrophus]|uniref:Uncharacterized protein n=1 Tax=Roseateles oligotrophus TaxID=1769250 RepID=A0A840LBA9_9BURK|nr:hypothetical protein [Roseateles oligotrophus]MBB4842627.1 hypothetical protein [Roseateles oligotrophus]